MITNQQLETQMESLFLCIFYVYQSSHPYVYRFTTRHQSAKPVIGLQILTSQSTCINHKATKVIVARYITAMLLGLVLAFPSSGVCEHAGTFKNSRRSFSATAYFSVAYGGKDQ